MSEAGAADQGGGAPPPPAYALFYLSEDGEWFAFYAGPSRRQAEEVSRNLREALPQTPVEVVELEVLRAEPAVA